MRPWLLLIISNFSEQGTNRHNDILVSVLLQVAETIIELHMQSHAI